MAEQPFHWDDLLQYVALTDIGMRRANNQDAHAVVLGSDMASWNKRGHLFMVADGMGAHAAGELASKLAVDGVSHLYHKYSDLSPPEALQKAILETNGEIHRRGQANSDFHNMGTTASVLLILPQGAFVAHIGDSRVYRLQKDRFEQLTRDHSLVWELQELGHFSEGSDYVQSIPKNVITRSLGPNATVQVDIEGPLPIQQRDTFLLCSDGLTGKIEDHEIAAIMANLPPREAAHLLIDLANLRGGPDNITVIVAKVVGSEMATTTAGATPIKLVGRGTMQKTQPAIWVVVAVCLLAAVALMITGDNNRIPALVALLSGMAALIVGLMSRMRRGKRGVSLTDGRRLGRGPYRETPCPSRKDAVQLLSNVAQNVRHLPAAEDLNLDWSQFDAHCQAAAESLDAGQDAEALRDYSRAIRCLMQKVRDEQNRKAGDSSIDY